MAAEFAPLIAEYGYAATLVGVLLEGETVLILSGLAAYRGYLSIPVLVAIGATGALLTDNLFFAMGRVLGPAFLKRFPGLAPSVARAHALVERLPNSAVIGVRFLYGMRTVGPAVIGAGNMPWARFLMLDALGACLWSAGWISGGYLLGEAVEPLLAVFTPVGRWLLAGVVTATLLLTGVLYLRHRRRDRAVDAKVTRVR
jgi:membrane protein DedA with SNARE-associated domain